MTDTLPHDAGLWRGVESGAEDEEFLGLLRAGTALVEPVLREAVGRLHVSLASVCRYHLGWDGAPSVAGTGKRVRPVLALLSVRSAGAPERFAAVAGTAVELVHQLSLLHDDIMDGDTERRGRPTAWAHFGTGAAVLTGDALVVQAVATIFHARAPGPPPPPRS